MNTPTHCLAAALAAAAIIPAMAQDNRQTPQQFERTITRTVGARYLQFLPPEYERDTTKRWPLILFLHGAGERGNDLQLVTKHGPPKIVRQKPELPFIIVSPQCPEGRRWDTDTVMALLDHAVANLRVDTNRVYLTGLSMGGYGTWSAGLSHPERFAAIAPICGGGEPIALLLADSRKVAALKSLPVWAFHGAKDPVVPLAESQRMVDALKRFGAAEVQLTVYPEAEHDSWTETYDNPRFYDWLLQHRRAP